MTELNTLLGLPKDFDVSTLSVGKKYIVTKPRERSFPLHIAMLLVTHDWNFLGYCVVHMAKNFEEKCELEFEVISLFTDNEKAIYKKRFLEAAETTGEIN